MPVHTVDDVPIGLPMGYQNQKSERPPSGARSPSIFPCGKAETRALRALGTGT